VGVEVGVAVGTAVAVAVAVAVGVDVGTGGQVVVSAATGPATSEWALAHRT
jgi:hypothetical protein